MLHSVVPLEAGLNFSGVNTLLGLLAGAVVIVVGIGIVYGSRKGGTRKAADVGGGAFIGILVIAAGLSFSVMTGAAQSMLRFLFS